MIPIKINNIYNRRMTSSKKVKRLKDRVDQKSFNHNKIWESRVRFHLKPTWIENQPIFREIQLPILDLKKTTLIVYRERNAHSKGFLISIKRIFIKRLMSVNYLKNFVYTKRPSLLNFLNPISKPCSICKILWSKKIF